MKAASGAQSGRNAVENNLLGKVLVEGCAIAAPCLTKFDFDGQSGKAADLIQFKSFQLLRTHK
ncbi:VENN motif pre-toxin domain-containing protein [Pectobacterium versatile]|uniref:VENN motif pre-toxin domain-containing protein n=1 Tax=Pectobacterium versatile TaxID=2488639 RepID=UPI00381BB2F6